MIGNPPYNELRDLDEQLQKLYKKCKFQKYAQGGRINLFQYFYPLGIDIAKKGGIINFIVQNSLLGEDSAYNNRKLIFDNTKINHIDSFPERDNVKLRVFESAKMSVCICFLEKKENCENDNFSVFTWKDRFMTQKKVLVLSKQKIRRLYPEDLTIPICAEEDFILINKIKDNASNIKISSSAGEIDMTKYKPYFTSNFNNVRIITGAQVQRYFITDTPQQGGINYIEKAKVCLANERKDSFKNERIVMQRITGVDSKIRLISTLLSPNYFCANSTNYISQETNELPLKFILGLLNSKLLNYFFKQTSTNTNITAKEILKFPVPICNSSQQTEIISLVDTILTEKQKNNSYDTSTFEDKIDEKIYDLFGLTKKERDFINTRI